jgi:hypothetical protein
MVVRMQDGGHPTIRKIDIGDWGVGFINELFEA